MEPDDEDRSEPVEHDDEAEPEAPERASRKSGLEGLLRTSLRKAVEKGIEAGIGTLKSADSVVSKVVDEVRLPKEISTQIMSQIDETKNVVIRAIAHEVRDFLEATDLATELQKALTSLSFEIRTEIRFIPNEAGIVRPEVKSQAVPRVSRGPSESTPPAPPNAGAPTNEPDDHGSSS